MQANDESSQTKQRPAWLIAFIWSVVGVLAAVLTIFVLTASLLWLLRWTNPAGPWTSSTGFGGTGEAVSSGPASLSANQTSTAAHLTTEAAVRSSATPSSLETSPETAGQPSPTLPATGQSDPLAEGTPEPGSSQPAMAETAETSASVPTFSASVTTASGGLSEQPDPDTQPPPRSSLPLPATQTRAESQVTSVPSEPGDQPGQTSEQAPVPGSANVRGTPASASAGSTVTPSVRPSATPSPTPTNSPTPTPTPAPEPQEYIVQGDDWLSRLADKFYGDLLAYPAIVEATNARATVDDSYTFITDPDVIEIGQKLWIPTTEEAAVLLAGEE